MKQHVTNVLVHVAWQVHAYAVLESVPRTAWAISWAVRSGMAYTALAAHPVRAHTLCEIILFRLGVLHICSMHVCHVPVTDGHVAIHKCGAL